jgi:hypothetical protein
LAPLRAGDWKFVRWVLLAVTCLSLVACGSEEQRVAGQSKPAATEAPDPRATPDPTELEIRQDANAYLKAYARGDWTGVCDTLVPSERRYFDELGGRCEHVFRQTVRVSRRERRQLRNALASDIRIGRHQAVIEVTESGWRDPIMRLYAIEEAGAWGIARSKKRREKTGSA